MQLKTLLLFSLLSGTSSDVADGSKEWRIVNGKDAEYWTILGLAFFEDDACSKSTGDGEAFASPAADKTALELAFSSGGKWKSAGACPAGECFFGFRWMTEKNVRCILISHNVYPKPPEIILQKYISGAWTEVVTWVDRDISKNLAVACPAAPSFEHGAPGTCRQHSAREQECDVLCDPGFGSTRRTMTCENGAWTVPICRESGSMMRLVAMEPERIEPFWTVLDVEMFEDTDCSTPIKAEGLALGSRNYVIKYASYHSSNAFDGDRRTSWSSHAACSPGECYVGFRFYTTPSRIGCVIIHHPEGGEHFFMQAGSQYRATKVSLEILRDNGWTEEPDAAVHLYPRNSDEL